MNNYEYQGNQQPTECEVCFSSMTEHKDGRVSYLKCDNTKCVELKELESDDG